MNVLDIVFAAIIAFLVIRGIYRGLLVELAALGGVILGFFLANKYHLSLSSVLQRAIPNEGWAGIIAYLVIFIACIVLLTMIAKSLKKILTFAFTSLIDHVGGGIIGFLEGVLFCCILLLVLQNFLPDANFVIESRFAPFLKEAVEFLEQFLPKEFI